MDRRAVAVGGLFVVVLLVGTGISTAVPDARVTVQDVTVDPGTPIAGDSVTITPTIANSVGSDEPVTIESVTATIDGEEIANETNVGALAAGDDVAVPVTATFDEPGQYSVRFDIQGNDTNGNLVNVTRNETITVSAVSDVRMSVDDAAVEPATPTVGAPTTVSVTVDSSGGSAQPVEVDSMSLSEGDQTLVSATNVGTLSPGDTLTVPLTTTFSSAGEQTLVAEFRGTNANEDPVVVTQPVTIVTEKGAPVFEARPAEAIEGVDIPVPVTVANPTEATLRNVVVTVGGVGVEQVIDRRIVPALDPGESTNLSFLIRPENAGEVLLRTDVSYTTAAGTTDTVVSTEALPVELLDPDVSVRVTTIDEQPSGDEENLGVDIPGGVLDGGGDEETQTRQGDVSVTVSNVGNAPVQNVILEPRAGNLTLGPRPVTDELAPGTEESVVVSLERTPASRVRFETTYEVANGEAASTAVFDPGAQRGSVAVTGVDLETENGDMVITGDIGNPGDGEVSGVVIAVGDGEDVTPAYPGRDFFVGAVEGNGFAPFELTATVDENATQIPLSVEYVVGGDQRTERVILPVEGITFESSDGGRSWFLIVGVVAILLGALIVLGVSVRRR